MALNEIECEDFTNRHYLYTNDKFHYFNNKLKNITFYGSSITVLCLASADR